MFFSPQRPTKFVSNVPDVVSHTLRPGIDSCLILASDGLWDVMKNEEAVKLVHSCACASEAAKKLVRVAKLNDTHDNITAVVVKIGYSD